ncbi:MAG: hypothetical protein NTY98_11225 [Verrucomicrobia bacterium]|nr:hypothetical protein [Verrucomicrobiota bacterium]
MSRFLSGSHQAKRFVFIGFFSCHKHSPWAIEGFQTPPSLSLLVSCWKASAGVHELHWEANRAKIVSNGRVMFDGSLQEFKTIVGDQLGYDLHVGVPFVYRLENENINDDLRALLDAACMA